MEGWLIPLLAVAVLALVGINATLHSALTELRTIKALVYRGLYREPNTMTEYPYLAEVEGRLEQMLLKLPGDTPRL